MSMKSFPKPPISRSPPGAEGWEELYPYYLVFQDARGRGREKFWFCDWQHWPTVFKPFDTIDVEFACKCLGQYNTRHLMIPTANGIDYRIHIGYLYMSPLAVPEDISPPGSRTSWNAPATTSPNWATLLETGT